MTATISDARLRANRSNSKKSTGPSPAGLLRTRANALRHGLTAETLACEEDRDEIEVRVAEYTDDMRPDTPAKAALVRRLATRDVQMEKAARWQLAEQAKDVRHAAEKFDEDRFEEAEALFDVLASDPRKILRKLKKTPEGVDRLLEAWSDIREELICAPKPAWSGHHIEIVAKLLGLRPDHVRMVRLAGLTRGTWGYFAGLTPEDGGQLDDTSRKAWCRDRLLERIDAEVATLQAHRATLDHETIALDRAEAGDRALFNSSPKAILARRYEAAAERSYFKSLDEFRELEAESAAIAEAAPQPQPEPVPPPDRPEPAEKVASFRNPVPSAGVPTETAPREARTREVPVGRGADGVPSTPGRAPRPAG